jgi:hypothetical protein
MDLSSHLVGRSMGRLLMAGLFGLLGIGAGCSGKKTEALCEKSVRHMLAVSQAPLAGVKVAPAERAIMEAAVQASLATCRSEGLSQEQADCILAVKDVQGLAALRTCPAIAAKKPRWLILPPTDEDLDALRKQFGKKPAESP